MNWLSSALAFTMSSLFSSSIAFLRLYLSISKSYLHALVNSFFNVKTSHLTGLPSLSNSRTESLSMSKSSMPLVLLKLTFTLASASSSSDLNSLDCFSACCWALVLRFCTYIANPPTTGSLAEVYDSKNLLPHAISFRSPLRAALILVESILK